MASSFRTAESHPALGSSDASASHRVGLARASWGSVRFCYQICLICGTADEYDWKRMRRTDRLLVTNEQHPLALAQTRFPGAVN